MIPMLKNEVVIPEGPYVYGLVDHSGSIFYIGKGRRLRLFQHRSDAMRGKPGEKCERIRETVFRGADVRYVIFGEYETDQEAGEVEKEIISYTSGLTNKTKGGEIGAFSPRTAIMRRAARLYRRLMESGFPADHPISIEVEKQSIDPAPNVASWSPATGVVFGWERAEIKCASLWR